MELSEQQLKIFRQPFEEAGMFTGYSEEQIRKTLEGVVDIYITLANINLRTKEMEK